VGWGGQVRLWDVRVGGDAALTLEGQVRGLGGRKGRRAGVAELRSLHVAASWAR
jgi:hypothetical protein